METVGEWLVSSGIASNGFAAGHIIDGLKLNGLPREEQEARARLYRAWRSKTEKDKKKLIPSYQAYQLAIYGLAPGDVVERQRTFLTQAEAEKSLGEYIMREAERERLIDMKIDAQNNE